MANAILLISCRDKKGITSSITHFIAEKNGNIIYADQYIDVETNTFFLRIEWDMDKFNISREEIKQEFLYIANTFDMTWQVYFSDEKVRLAIFVSKHLHCLYDLLYRYASGQFLCEIPCIISNHEDAHYLADQFNIPYYYFKITEDNKSEQEKKEIDILKDHNVDLIVLARYHQILTKHFVETFSNRIINIHHSFLPAFVGQNPYVQAYRKGVKVIGATSHYVTAELDQGPIIDQDTVRISHHDKIEDLVRKGGDLEKIVLNRAIRFALDHKILIYENKTVIFD